MTRTARNINSAALACAACLLALLPASAHASVSITRAGNQLLVIGDAAPNRIAVDRTVAGNIRVDVNADGSFEHSTSTISNTVVIDFQGHGGDDHVTLDETNGALPSASLNGDVGDDILQGGSNQDFVVGGVGDDRIETRAAVDTIAGGPDDDTIVPGPGDEFPEGDDGDDTFVWNDGDGSDTSAGEAGSDLQVVNGRRGSEHLALDRNGVAAVTVRDAINDKFEIDASTVERVRFNGNEGADELVAANDLSGALEAVEVNFGRSSLQPNVYDGSDVTDIVSPGEGINEIATQEGDDRLNWSLPFRRRGSVEADLGSGNDVLAVEASEREDEFEAAVVAGKLRVSLEPDDASAEVAGADELRIDTGDGEDSFTPAPGVTSLVTLDVFGAGGNDTLFGSSGAETLRGGKGDDTIVANGGDDQLHGDAGTDTLVGGAGRDSFFCGGLGDTFEATAEDSVAPDCLEQPVAPPAGPPVSEPPVSEPPAGTEPGLPAGFKGFARPVVRARGLGDLKVRLRNTHSDAITLRVAASERGASYAAVARTIQPGASTRITLRVPARLRATLRRKLAKAGRLVRRPRVRVTHVATGGSTAVRPRIRVKRAAR